MLADFTKLIEDAIGTLEDVERDDASANAESGSMIVTLADGRKFRIVYARIWQAVS